MIQLDDMYGEDVPLMVPGTPVTYVVQELPEEVMPLVNEYISLLERKENYQPDEARLRFIEKRMKNIEAQMEDKGYVRTDDGMWGKKTEVAGTFIKHLMEDEHEEYPFDTGQWHGIWIEAAIRITALVSIEKWNSKNISGDLTEEQKRAVRAAVYKVLGTKMRMDEKNKAEVHKIIARAEQFLKQIHGFS